jgi:hypothetical protein
MGGDLDEEFWLLKKLMAVIGGNWCVLKWIVYT